MLIRFTLENFLSFKDKVIFSLIPGKGTLKAHHKSDGVNGLKVLKTAVIFGANASGKSNLIKAIDFGKKLVLNGTKADSPIYFDSFKLDVNYKSKNTLFEYEIQHKNKNYAYGFVFNSKEIVEEWLYVINKKSENLVFQRTNSNKFDLSNLLKINNKDEKQFIEFTSKGTPRNQLFLTHIRNTNIVENVSNISDILNVIDWFQNALTVIYPDSKNITKKFELLKSTDLQKVFSEFLDYFDTGIDGIEFESINFEKLNIPIEVKDDILNDLLNIKSEKKVSFLSNVYDDKYYVITKNQENQLEAKLLKTKHKVAGGYYELFNLNNESDGTRRIMDLIPIIIDFLKGDNVFIVDEMERSLHPNLIYDFFDFLLSKSKGINSQFIVTSHESILLNQKLLRKDEIWFVVKNSLGESQLHSLEDYNVRFDKDVRKDYLLGRYKGIPKIGNRNEITFL